MGYKTLDKTRCRLESRDDGGTGDIMVRLPQPHAVAFPVERTLRETATMNFISLNNGIPIPRVLSSGKFTPHPEIGRWPFIIIPYVENCGGMSQPLTAHFEDLNEDQRFKPEISEDVLEELYCCLSDTALRTWVHAYDVSDLLVKIATGDMRNLHSRWWDSQYHEHELTALAEAHMAQLVFQHNDMVTSEDDCRNKYVARRLFPRLAKQGQQSIFGIAEDDWLWCDDLQPHNVLFNDAGDTAAVIGWGVLRYAAPTQFSLDPPWCLLFENPECWQTGLADFSKTYDKRVKAWLRSMNKAEPEKNQKMTRKETRKRNKAPLRGPTTLCTYMRESWKTGRFWLNYAARKAVALDTIYWSG
ncbi:hypothetical protein QBC46DRAFT_412658 [Diplogelasinospora grovesii]|uniref:Aminoglycoside phosphotransferase domain-containing protein n=1 Tax=Diplogelasinospora grovesii TaxID=303347 RepID=A0AAN6N099_9PEZI|nr:hypothetical protein QBC46DRAFT_412658 [Diplogelasinospora grovesii]